MKRKDLEGLLDSLAGALCKPHKPENQKYFLRINDRYIKLQREYRKKYHSFYEPKDY